MSDTTNFTFPSATPGADSVTTRKQKGIRYIGRVDTDGPAVWEALCDAFGMDSKNLSPDTLGALMKGFAIAVLENLPKADPEVTGALYWNGNFLCYSTGSPPQQE